MCDCGAEQCSTRQAEQSLGKSSTTTVGTPFDDSPISSTSISLRQQRQHDQQHLPFQASPSIHQATKTECEWAVHPLQRASSPHLFESDGSIQSTAAPSVSSLHGCRACGVNPNGAQSVPKFDAAECEWAVHPLQRASSPHLSIREKGRNIADDNVELSSSSIPTSAVAEIVNNSGVRHPDGMLERLGPTPIGSLTRESGLSREDGCREAAVMTCRVATSPASVPSSTLSPVQLTVRNGIPASAISAVAEANSTVGRSSDESDETSTSTTSPTLDMRSIAKSSLKTAIAAREQPPAWSNEINVVDYERRMASHFKQLQRLIDARCARAPSCPKEPTIGTCSLATVSHWEKRHI